MEAFADPVAHLLDAGASLDPEWESRVRSVPEPDRERLLDRAEALLECRREPEIRLAVACLHALESSVDPRAPRGAARVRRFLDVVGAHPSLEGLYRRASEGSADPDLELEAAVVAGQYAVARGELAEAERLYRSVIARTHGTGRRAERAASANFARLCLEGGREFEALVFARRAATLMRIADDGWGLAISQSYVCSVLRGIRDWERLRSALSALETHAAALAIDRRARMLVVLHGHRSALALADGDVRRALAEVDAAEALVPEAWRGTSEPRAGALLRGAALLRVGRASEAAAVLDAAARLGRPDDLFGYEIRCSRVVCTLALDGAAPAIAAARDLLAVLESDAARILGPGRRLEFASALGKTLSDVPGAEEHARRAYDVAAAAAIERLAEVERFVREWPDLAEADAEDLAVLADFRARSLAERSEMHRAVARLFESAAREGRSILPMFESDREYTCVCAWCQRARAQDGAWLPVQQFLPLPQAGRIRLTHGICPSCTPRAAADARAAPRRG